MRDELLKALGKPKPAPKNQKLTPKRKRQLNGRSLLPLIIEWDEENIPLTDVMDAVNADPDNPMKYTATNALGTLVGSGAGGHGFDLWRTATGNVIRCQENAVILIAVLTDEDVKLVAKKFGKTVEQLISTVEGLPSIAPEDEADAATVV